METKQKFARTGAANDFFTFLARLLLTIVFFTSVPAHFGAVDLGFAKAAGVPLASFVVPATGILALVGALSVLLGYHIRVGAWLLILFLTPVTLVMHRFWGVNDPMLHQLQQGMFLRNIAIIGGLFLVTQFGGGRWSLDGDQKWA